MHSKLACICSQVLHKIIRNVLQHLRNDEGALQTPEGWGTEEITCSASGSSCSFGSMAVASS